MNEELYQFLRDLPRRPFTSDIIFENEVVPSFVNLLGYDTDDLYYQATVERDKQSKETLNTDAIVSRNRDIRPWLVIEVKHLDQIFKDDETLPEQYEKRIATRTDLHGAERGVLISNSHLIVTSGEDHHTFVLTEIKEEEVNEICELLEPPESLPKEETATGPRPDRIDTPNFNLDIAAYEKALTSVESAESPNEKGDALEDLAELLFEGIPFVSIRHKNLQTATSELDLVLEFEGHDEPTIFDGFERFVPVECKNWNRSIGSSELRNFKGKMISANIDLGILLSKSGISGNKGSNAVRIIDQTFDNSGLAILVINNGDLGRINSGADFYQMLDEKLFDLRFDT